MGYVCHLLITSVFPRNIKQETRWLSAENEVGEDRTGLRKRYEVIIVIMRVGF